MHGSLGPGASSDRPSQLWFLLLLGVLAATLTACPKQTEVSSVSIVDGETTITVGSTTELTIKVVASPGSESVAWSSSDTGVATVKPVSNTVAAVTAVAPGSATISVASTVDPQKRDDTIVTVVAPTRSDDDNWIRQFGTESSDLASAVATDVGDNVIIAGFTGGSLPGSTSSGKNDAFVRKYNSAGVVAWTRQFGTVENDLATAAAADADGNVLVAGRTTGSLPGFTNMGLDDAFVRKYDPAGVQLWTRQIGTATYDQATAVASDSSGNVVVAGYTSGALGATNAGLADVFVRKYDASGTLVWARQFGTSQYDVSAAMAIDSSGNIVVVGSTSGSFSGFNNRGMQDIFIRKYGPSGEPLWTRQFGSTSPDAGSGVAVDPQGNVIVAGSTGGLLVYPYVLLGGDDVFVRKYDKAGAELWTEQFGSTSDDTANAIAVDAQGNAVVAGVTFGRIADSTSAGGADAFIRSFSADGKPGTVIQFGTIRTDEATSVSFDTKNAVLVAGYTLGDLGRTERTALDNDVFVRRFAAAP